MKKIGIIFAMNEEIDAFKENFCVDNEYNIFDLHFFEGIKGDNHCVLVISGVGKVNAARATQILIDNYKVDYIINVENECILDNCTFKDTNGKAINNNGKLKIINSKF